MPGVRSFDFQGAFLPKALAARGVDDLELLPHYPYRDDALLHWNAIRQWVEDYLQLDYTSDTDVAADQELQSWAREISSPDSGRIAGVAENNGGIHSRDHLADVVTMIIFTCSAQHAAVNFPQYDRLSENGRTIDQRNGSRREYRCLHPTCVPQSINI